MNIEAFTRLLQLSISPIVVISAVALLLLSVTNRLGRAIDRARALGKEIDEGHFTVECDFTEQLRVLLRRSELLRKSISLLIGSIFFSCLMILFLFLAVFMKAPIEAAVLASFGLSMLCVLGSVVYFLADISLALRALKIEVSRHLSPPNADGPSPDARSKTYRLPAEK